MMNQNSSKPHDSFITYLQVWWLQSHLCCWNPCEIPHVVWHMVQPPTKINLQLLGLHYWKHRLALPSGHLLHSYWKWPIYSGFTHWKWWFSIVCCMFTRGYLFSDQECERRKWPSTNLAIQAAGCAKSRPIVRWCIDHPGTSGNPSPLTNQEVRRSHAYPAGDQVNTTKPLLFSKIWDLLNSSHTQRSYGWYAIDLLFFSGGLCHRLPVFTNRIPSDDLSSISCLENAVGLNVPPSLHPSSATGCWPS